MTAAKKAYAGYALYLENGKKMAQMKKKGPKKLAVIEEEKRNALKQKNQTQQEITIQENLELANMNEHEIAKELLGEVTKKLNDAVQNYNIASAKLAHIM